MSPCALHDFFLGAIVMQTPMAHGKKHLRIICIMGFKPWDSSGTGGFKAPCSGDLQVVFHASKNWWVIIPPNVEEFVTFATNWVIWVLCCFRPFPAFQNGFIHAWSIHPSLPASWLAPWSASRRYRWQSFELFCQVDGDPWLDFRLSRKIVLFFFLGHNSKYDSFFLAFQVFAPFTWYKTSLLPESVTVKFGVLCDFIWFHIGKDGEMMGDSWGF